MRRRFHPVELTAPDLTPYRQGNTGIDYVFTFDSGQSGPHVAVNGLTHGNELCGAIALDALLRAGLRPRRGRLTLSFANIAAYALFDPQSPARSRFVDEDMNRLWAPAILDGPRQSTELARARQLRPLFDQIDYLLDLHSMQYATAPLLLCGTTARARVLALTLGAPQWVVSDAGHANGPRLLDYPRFSTPPGAQTVLLAECGQHWLRGSADFAVEIALRFLVRLGAIDPAQAAVALPSVPPLATLPTILPTTLIEVTDAVVVAGNRFRFVRDYVGMEIIDRAGTLIGCDDHREIRTPYDRCILILPAHRVGRGHTAVRLGRFAATTAPSAIEPARF